MNWMESARRIQEDLEGLSAFTATPGQGCTRLPFTPETRAAADFLLKKMEEAGLETWQDPAGNLFGLLPGRNREKPCILCGSHYDSVPGGGNYDGIAGVVCAIELARVLREEGITPDADYLAAAFMDEEGCRFGSGYFGSKAVLGRLEPEETGRLTDEEGVTLAQAMEGYGLKAGELPKAAWPKGRIGHFLEIHIEQGPVLDGQKKELGVVEGIVGLRRYRVAVNGRADHAGTTPMDMRADAVEMAARVIAQVGDMAREAGGSTVATVGQVNTRAGAVNIVARSLEFSLDIRSLQNEVLEEIPARIRRRLQEETEKTGGSFTMEETLRIQPVELSRPMRKILEESCRERGYSWMALPSGAGHDALAMGQQVDTAMLFVPSQAGRSHCPEEYTPPEAFGRAVQVMKDLIVRL